LLSNLLLVTESLTLIAVNCNWPVRANSYRRYRWWFLLVTPLISAAIPVQRSEGRRERSPPKSVEDHGCYLVAAVTLCRIRDRSSEFELATLCARGWWRRPSSRIMFGSAQCSPATAASALQSKIWLVHDQCPRASLALPGEDGEPAGFSDGPSRSERQPPRPAPILGREDVAAGPAHPAPERDERFLDENPVCTVSVDRSGDASAGERLRFTEFPHGAPHEAGHLVSARRAGGARIRRARGRQP
jgi:hypothetical protein